MEIRIAKKQARIRKLVQWGIVTKNEDAERADDDEADDDDAEEDEDDDDELRDEDELDWDFISRYDDDDDDDDIDDDDDEEEEEENDIWPNWSRYANRMPNKNELNRHQMGE